MNSQLAIHFIQTHGNPVEQARLHYLRHQQLLTAEILAHFAASQRPDGGWAPFWALDYSSVDATCYHLAQADQLGLGKEALIVERAVTEFLSSRQLEDGSWQEDATVADVAPPWATPGDLAATLYLTANSGYWLARFAPGASNAKRAAQFLARHTQEGQLPSFLHTHWLAAGLWQQLGWHDTVEATLTHLSSKLAEMAADNLAWLITALRGVEIPASHLCITQALPLLLAKQETDGRWRSDDDPDFDVHVTLEALRALQLCGAPEGVLEKEEES